MNDKCTYWAARMFSVGHAALSTLVLTGMALLILMTLPGTGIAQTLNAVSWPGRPAFESMPCPQRREQVLQFWGTLPRLPDACTRARKTLAVAQDLVATKRACGETTEWRTVETEHTVAEHAEAARAACASSAGSTASAPRKLAAGDAGRAAGCPMAISVNGQQSSILDPISAEGSAANALRSARQTLNSIVGQGSCSQFGAQQQECEENRRVWQDTVRALECHASAEQKAGGASSAGVSKGHPQAEESGATLKTPGKDANAFLDFGEKGRTKSDGGSKGKGGADAPKGKGAAAFLSFGGDGGGDGESAFPTPFCRFISDSKDRHDPETQVCVGKTVYICLGRSSPRGSDAWQVLGTSGCGTVRTIQAVEEARRADRARTKIYED